MTKKMIYRNIFGRKVNVESGGEGTSIVSALPATGEQGKVYYNTTDNKYYIYDGEEFKEFGVTNPPIVTDLEHSVRTIDVGGHLLSVGDTYTLQPNVYYDLGTVLESADIANDSIMLDTTQSTDVALPYMGRFTVPDSLESITLYVSSSVVIPDEQAEKLASLEAGHTYEFNIFANVFMISDITATE